MHFVSTLRSKQPAAQNMKTDYFGFLYKLANVWETGYRLGDLILFKGCHGVRDWWTHFGIAVFVLFAQFSRYVETEWRSEYWLHVWWIVVQAFCLTLTACMGSCTQGCDSWERGRSGGRWDCVCVCVCVCVCRWGFDGGEGWSGARREWVLGSVHMLPSMSTWVWVSCNEGLLCDCFVSRTIS